MTARGTGDLSTCDLSVPRAPTIPSGHLLLHPEPLAQHVKTGNVLDHQSNEFVSSAEFLNQLDKDLDL